MRNRRGFTLLELLIVVIIIAILVAVALPLYGRAVEKGRMAEAITNLGALRGALLRYYTQHNDGTTTVSELDWTDPNTSGMPGTVRFGTYIINYADTGQGAGDYNYQCTRKVGVEESIGVTYPYTVTMAANGNITAPF